MLTYEEILEGKEFYFAKVNEKYVKDGKHLKERRYGGEYIFSRDLLIIRSDGVEEEINLKTTELKSLIINNKMLVFDLQLAKDDSLRKRNYTSQECGMRILSERKKRIDLLNETTKQSENNIMEKHMTFQEDENSVDVIKVIGIVGEEQFHVANIHIFETSCPERYLYKINDMEGNYMIFVAGNDFPLGRYYGHGVIRTLNNKQLVGSIIAVITNLVSGEANES